MTTIKVNDIFDELIVENNRLLNELLFAKKCLKVLIGFKTHLNLCFNQLTTNLCSKDLQIFNDLDNEYKEVLNQKQKYFIESNDKSIEEFNEIFGENIKTDISIDSKTNPKPNESINCLSVLTQNRPIDPNPDYSVQTYKCDSCDRVFSQSLDLIRHKSSHNRDKPKPKANPKHNRRCDECGLTFKVKRDFDHHMRRHNNDRAFRCSICVKDFYTQYDLSLHEKTHSDARPYRCTWPGCAKTYKASTALWAHKKTHRTDQNLLSENRRFECNECDYKTFTNAYLKVHIRRHKNDRPFQCRSCDKKFSSKSELNKHDRARHRKEKEFKCEYSDCSYETYDMCFLKRHYLKHKNIRQFVCNQNECRKRFLTLNELQMHQKLHREVRAFRCEWPGCDRSFLASAKLNDHMNIHLNKRQFKCDSCDKGFNTLRDLNTHKNIHLSVKPYPCNWPDCGKRFTQSHSLIDHQSRHQKIPLKCRFDGCDKSYSVVNDLNRHISKAHK